MPQDDDTGVGRGVRKALPDEHSTTPSRGPHERNQSPQTASAAPANNPVHRSAKPPPQQHPLGALRSPRTSRHRRSRAPVPSSTHTKGERGCFLPHLPRWVTRSTPAEGGRGEVRQGDPGLHWASFPQGHWDAQGGSCGHRPRSSATALLHRDMQRWGRGTLVGGQDAWQPRARERGRAVHRAKAGTTSLGPGAHHRTSVEPAS